MPLLSFFATNPDGVDQLTIEQVVSNAGDGILKDNNLCSNELRTYLGQIGTLKIESYIEHCLTIPYAKSGVVLQDLINELGRRLDYEVKNGLYQGTKGEIGYDGLWRSPEAHSLVLEVKTTDAYRLSLETLAVYRSKLASANKLESSSSILIVVGREDTGELEAQIRGSRHAWDVRVISAEALIKLVLIKENSEAPETGLKIRSILTPVEYTRLDRMVDVMFTTVIDVEAEQPVEEPVEEPSEVIDGQGKLNSSLSALIPAKLNWSVTEASLLQAKREEIVLAIGHREETPLIRKTRALYWSASHDLRVVCSISKRYSGKNQNPYWYAYHPAWADFLDAAELAYFVLGCMDRNQAYAIPRDEINKLLPFLHTTTNKDGSVYWHIHIVEKPNGPELVIPKSAKGLALAPFAVPV